MGARNRQHLETPLTNVNCHVRVTTSVLRVAKANIRKKAPWNRCEKRCRTEPPNIWTLAAKYVDPGPPERRGRNLGRRSVVSVLALYASPPNLTSPAYGGCGGYFWFDFRAKGAKGSNMWSLGPFSWWTGNRETNCKSGYAQVREIKGYKTAPISTNIE